MSESQGREKNLYRKELLRVGSMREATIGRFLNPCQEHLMLKHPS